MPYEPCRCFWCRKASDRRTLTLDHLIPRWAVRRFPELLEYQAHVRSCAQCNTAKGGTPPALFAAIRNLHDVVGAENRRWSEIRNALSVREPEEVRDLIALTMAEMVKPLPAWYDVEAHRREWLRSGGHPLTVTKRFGRRTVGAVGWPPEWQASKAADDEVEEQVSA